MPHTLYCITHRESGREYIGVTSRTLAQRWREHTHGRGQTRIARAFKKYGADAFAMHVQADLPTRAELLIAERIAIAIRKPEFNLTSGGEGTRLLYGRVHSAETRAKIAATLTGRKLPEAHRAKLRGRVSNKRGVPMSEEVKAKVSASRRLSAKPTPEMIARRSASLKAHYANNPEARVRCSEIAYRRWRKAPC
jgi:group I intron endonuclease